VIRGPHHLKELVLLVRHDLLARLKRFDGNNVATLKSRSSLEVATDVSHVLYESLFAKQATAAVDPRDFRGNIDCNSIFSSPLDFNHFSHGLCIARSVPIVDELPQRKQTTYNFIF
jgi:hypothetical protein